MNKPCDCEACNCKKDEDFTEEERSIAICSKCGQSVAFVGKAAEPFVCSDCLVQIMEESKREE